VLGDLEHRGQLGPAEATTPNDRQAVTSAVTDYARYLWNKYAPEYGARPDVPSVAIRFGERQTVGWTRAKAFAQQHVIQLDHRACRRAWLVHEVGHLLTLDGHGPAWARTLVKLWAAEFDIPAARSIALAAEHGIEVDPRA
jgi:hypothetical protein